jgi:hypothetical protein
MKDDYLWDKSGEPDPEIQKLEEILGTLRYQPKPLELPQDVRLQQRRNYFPWVAIAATVVIALLAGIIWLRVRTNSVPQEHQANAPEVSAPPRKEKVTVTNPPKKDAVPDKPVENVAINRKPRSRPSMTPVRKQEREEGLAAKEQLMLALRLASEKLNMAHRKTQTTPPANQIKNQHRIG